MPKSLVVGLGEIGQPLFEILQKAYPEVVGYDIKSSPSDIIPTDVDVLNICIPYSRNFIMDVRTYQEMCKPTLTIVHSTVPVGTTELLQDAVHSPVLGRHRGIKEEMMLYKKWIGGRNVEYAARFLGLAGFRCRTVSTSRETEALKLMCLAKYGVSIAFAMYQKKLCELEGIPFEHTMEWDHDYNGGVGGRLHRPIVIPDSAGIGGHCVVPGMKLLNKDYPSKFLEEAVTYGRMG